MSPRFIPALLLFVAQPACATPPPSSAETQAQPDRPAPTAPPEPGVQTCEEWAVRKSLECADEITTFVDPTPSSTVRLSERIPLYDLCFLFPPLRPAFQQCNDTPSCEDFVLCSDELADKSFTEESRQSVCNALVMKRYGARDALFQRYNPDGLQTERHVLFYQLHERCNSDDVVYKGIRRCLSRDGDGYL